MTANVFPKIAAIAGHRGTYLLRREAMSEIEFVVLTFWDSMEAVQKFAGSDPSRAVVKPEARSILSSFDDTVVHYAVTVAA
ncbi:MAG: antibiotic biosynthesis monooxygenase [Candidatus Eremiobacteraeota bacterium]|nr:antibiotic biosynthesis monooxygenase [Candidatus Eremiobacteraeota bacterium]